MFVCLSTKALVGSPLSVHRMVGYLSLVSYYKVSKDGNTDERMLMICSLLTGADQLVRVPVNKGPGGLAPLSAQDGRLPFTYAIL